MALTDAELDGLIYLGYVLRGSDPETRRVRAAARELIEQSMHMGEFLRILPERLRVLDAREQAKKQGHV